MCAALKDLEAQDILSGSVTKMEDDNMAFCSASLRRWWLLKKALADHNLVDALKLAKEAEAFILAAEEVNSRGDTGQVPTTCGESAPSAILEATQASEMDAFSSEERNKFTRFESSLIQPSEAACLDDDIQSSGLPKPGPSAPLNQVGAERSENEEVSILSNTASSSLATLVSMQQVVTFLRQCGDVVVSIPDSKFLINGRFQENATELINRANRIRNRQGKPPFEVLVSNIADEADHAVNSP
jgi:hypothetical protein